MGVRIVLYATVSTSSQRPKFEFGLALELGTGS